MMRPLSYVCVCAVPLLRSSVREREPNNRHPLRRCSDRSAASGGRTGKHKCEMGTGSGSAGRKGGDGLRRAALDRGRFAVHRGATAVELRGLPLRS